MSIHIRTPRPGPAIIAGLVMMMLAAAARGEVDLKHRWVYVQTNLQVDANADWLLGLMQRAQKANYTGVMLADSKFAHLNSVIPRYFTNLERVKSAAAKLKLDLVPCIFPVGYSNSILSQDVNLAAGLPVRDAPFVVRGGRLVPQDGLAVAGGDFEQVDRRGTFVGWQWQDPAVTIDRSVRHGGLASGRFADIPKHSPDHGHARIMLTLDTQPFRYHHVSLWIRTKELERPDSVRLQVLVEGGSLQYQHLRLKRNQDWTQHHVAFNTLDHRQVRLYVGAWGGRGGTMWLDDLKLEPGGFVNVLRRPGCPVKLTSLDGKITYAEGRDVTKIVDPKLGMEPWAGGYRAWHEPPVVKVPPGSRLHDGDKLLASYYHPAIVHDSQVSCTLTEPKLYTELAKQMRVMHKAFGASAAGYMMSHDEYRTGGWDALADAKGWTTGQWMADNIRRCRDIAREVRPGAPLYVWSDMFDPNHNARANYYLVKGTLAGAWEGLHKDIVVINWYFGRRDKNLPWFAARGHKQILAAYYDGRPEQVLDWLKSADKVDGVIGVMYTTWQRKYDDLERFSELVDGYLARPK